MRERQPLPRHRHQMSSHNSHDRNPQNHEGKEEDDDRKMPARPRLMETKLANLERTDANSEASSGTDPVAMLEDLDDDEEEEMEDEAAESVESDEESSAGSQSHASATGSITSGQETGPPDRRNLDAFREYCLRAKQFAPLEPKYRRAIKLLDILRQKKTSLKAYEDLMRWHLLEMKLLLPGEALGDCPEYVSRKAVLNFLKKRYNMHGKMPFTKPTVLPRQMFSYGGRPDGT